MKIRRLATAAATTALLVPLLVLASGTQANASDVPPAAPGDTAPADLGDLPPLDLGDLPPANPGDLPPLDLGDLVPVGSGPYPVPKAQLCKQQYDVNYWVGGPAFASAQWYACMA
ncbi:hypothetical protein ACFC6L_16390 [Kitasatospora phosalacinea]|uniref:hypothetical protein n=1 Tax=Kitasatospora phosalacinea TaxID=2065 RepID=UPI0035DE1059